MARPSSASGASRGDRPRRSFKIEAHLPMHGHCRSVSAAPSASRSAYFTRTRSRCPGLWSAFQASESAFGLCKEAFAIWAGLIPLLCSSIASAGPECASCTILTFHAHVLRHEAVFLRRWITYDADTQIYVFGIRLCACHWQSADGDCVAMLEHRHPLIAVAKCFDT